MKTITNFSLPSKFEFVDVGGVFDLNKAYTGQGVKSGSDICTYKQEYTNGCEETFDLKSIVNYENTKSIDWSKVVLNNSELVDLSKSDVKNGVYVVKPVPKAKTDTEIAAVKVSFTVPVPNHALIEKSTTTGQNVSVGDSLRLEVAVYRHPYEAVKTVEPTCSTKGYTEYSCPICGKTIKDDYVNTMPHTYKSSPSEIVYPTCTKKGYSVYRCAVCGYSHKTEYVKEKGHDYAACIYEPTNTKSGYTEYICLVCGKKYKTNIVPSLNKVFKSKTSIIRKIEKLKRQAKIKTNKIKGSKGYQVQYSLKKNFKGKKTVSKKKEMPHAVNSMRHFIYRFLSPDLRQSGDDLLFAGKHLGQENMVSAEFIQREGGPDNLRIPGKEEFCTLLQHIGDHQNGNIVIFFLPDDFQHTDEFIHLLKERIGIDRGDLGDGQGMGRQMEFLDIVFYQRLSRHIRGYAPGEHRPAKLPAIDAGMACKAFSQHFVMGRAGRALEHDRI